MLVPLDLLINVIGLDLSKNLNNSLLQPSLSHQLFIIWSSKSLLSNLNPLNWLHLIPDLIILLGHELSIHIFIKIIITLKDQNIPFLSEINQIKYLNTWESAIQIIMKMFNILVG